MTSEVYSESKIIRKKKSEEDWKLEQRGLKQLFQKRRAGQAPSVRCPTRRQRSWATPSEVAPVCQSGDASPAESRCPGVVMEKRCVSKLTAAVLKVRVREGQTERKTF